MFGIDSSELAVIALVALLVIGPKDLPRVMRMVGGWVARGRAMTRHVRAGFDTMMREAELEEMQKAWAAQNEAIMKATALPDPIGNSMAGIDPASWALPDPMAADVAALPAPAAAETVTPTVVEPVVVEPVIAADAPVKKPRAPRKKKTPAAEA
ncbi:Sec-independent protein translocase protein TatB [Polymorphobacter fuscus]|uniref:Twin-arginine translocase subunit TatB n=1 Tax=Sandarakinorhabdus fusca TaxID=1439888 RepID=A0A7C9GQI3_9SPHN|nr:Sec-independent protein translocase protein TatB [Polymorphobacter fuscus]KAB7646455.1 twin-arginine translocase subunit TatB [Polymorphobacter fuscus]MQT17696.1 twin-arginine translocase subunit TatB [Polymorphobacter fuscus]NJC09758.1 sec-independent protein translocase protein TatB [Polymorphobacter fuscus]